MFWGLVRLMFGLITLPLRFLGSMFKFGLLLALPVIAMGAVKKMMGKHRPYRASKAPGEPATAGKPPGRY